MANATTSLTVNCENISSNPKCPHGPTLLFIKNHKHSKNHKSSYYACSAYRNLDGCSFYRTKSDKNFNDEELPKTLLYNVQEIKSLRDEICLLKPELRCFCHTCNIPFNYSKDRSVHYKHEKLIGISNDLYKTPTNFLRPLSNDKAEAQYFFKKTTLEFFEYNLKKLKINKIVCIGVPRLHEYLKSKYDELKIQSILLDFDYRLFYFNDDKDFYHFNMFNNYFFEGEHKEKMFRKFLKVKKNESLLIITDPPFGCRTEPLAETLKQLIENYHSCNNINCILPIFWIFPYYMENYIQKSMPEMKMFDYKINYTNHESYSDNASSRKYGSPVRLFANIPMSMIEIPKFVKDYKFCDICCKWTAIENLHCDICKDCPSKNGETYRHCQFCAECVKPNYQHCLKCQRCTQKDNHKCDEYLKNLSCWICKKRGHLELNCDVEWKEKRRKKSNIKNGQRICLLCLRVGEHNEKKCPQRADKV